MATQREAQLLQERINRETTRHVKAGIAALKQYTGEKGQKPLYYEFREHKRAIYALYPDDKKKAQAIVRFILVKSGWAPKVTTDD